MEATIKGNCPNCGKPLEIPAELEEFSCLYCGARSKTADLRVKKDIVPGEFEKRREALRERLPKMVTRYLDFHKKITKKEFFLAFERYENENRATVDSIDPCVDACPDGEKAAVAALCKDLLDALDESMLADPRWGKVNGKNNVLFEVKVVLAIFFTPLLRKRGLRCAEDFRTELNRQWLERYPKQQWSPGDYEVMAGGFQKHKLCFITTATCAFEGKPDDCAELTAFRAFRDGWLTQHGGEDLVAAYYETAPGIVTCIELCDDPEARYAEIRTRWLEPCYRALQDGRMPDCRDRYVDMVRTLEKRYLQ
ncbi:MAG: hypothetical protein IJG45_08875 [Oscillospiraceae bacterium]|nr:hypothetical protein [Oscillospiraceae bacterium]